MCGQDGQCACSEVLSISTVSNCKLFNCRNMLNNSGCGWWMVVVCCGYGKSFLQNFLGGCQHNCHFLNFLRATCLDCAIVLPRWRVERCKLPRSTPMSRGDASMQWSRRVSSWWHMQAGYGVAKEPMQRCSSLSIFLKQFTLRVSSPQVLEPG